MDNLGEEGQLRRFVYCCSTIDVIFQFFERACEATVVLLSSVFLLSFPKIAEVFKKHQNPFFFTFFVNSLSFLETSEPFGKHPKFFENSGYT